jgi:hypothetical protein
VNGGDDSERLPSPIGQLVDLALRAYREHIGLYLLLAAAGFVIATIVEFAIPAHVEETVHEQILELVSVLCYAFVVTAVALGVGTQVAGEHLTPRTLLRGALYRWPGVVGASLLAQILADFVLPAGGFGRLEDPGYLVLAPVAWLLLGALGLAGPLAALSAELPLVAAFTGFGRALLLSLRFANIVRLAVLSFATVVPIMLESMLIDELRRRGVAHVFYLAESPIDSLIVGPLAAIQSIFALDFARRVGKIQTPRR